MTQNSQKCEDAYHQSQRAPIATLWISLELCDYCSLTESRSSHSHSSCNALASCSDLHTWIPIFLTSSTSKKREFTKLSQFFLQSYKLQFGNVCFIIVLSFVFNSVGNYWWNHNNTAYSAFTIAPCERKIIFLHSLSQPSKSLHGWWLHVTRLSINIR